MENTIYGLFRQIAQRQPEAPAIIENDRALSFRELAVMTDKIAVAFPEGTRAVGIIMRHRAEMIASIFAVLKAGAMYVPAEPAFPKKRIKYMMEEAGVDFILTDRESSFKMENIRQICPDCAICAAPADAKSDIAGSADPEDQPAGPAPDALAYVLYTSGTTGRPKGVAVTNRNVCHYVRAFENEFHPKQGDVMLQYSVCTFDIFVEEVFASLLNGAALAIPADEDKKDIRALMDFVQSHGVTILSGFPYLLAEINHLPKIPDSLRLLISGGDVLRAHQVDRLLDQAEVYNTYGPSETTVCASYYRCRGGQILEDGTYPIGKAVLGAEIRILPEKDETAGPVRAELPQDESAAQQTELPQGETGEICIFGGGVSNGYIGDHAEENEAFEKLPDGSTMYRSGDLGYMLPDGNIAFLHRKDTQIMIYGKRVEIMEVESQIYQCSGVEQAIVRAFTDEESQPYMVAYVVPEGEDLKISQIREELAEHLTDYMIPEFIVKIPEIPLNPNGKPDMNRIPIVMKEA